MLVSQVAALSDLPPFIIFGDSKGDNFIPAADCSQIIIWLGSKNISFSRQILMIKSNSLD